MAYYLRKENKKKGIYLQMYESHWDKEKKQPRSKSVMAFGYVQDLICFLQALFPQKCRLNSSKLHGEFPQYCISSAGTLSGAGEEPLQAYKVY